MTLENFDPSSLSDEEQMGIISGALSPSDVGIVPPTPKGLPTLIEDLGVPQNPKNKEGVDRFHTAGSWANHIEDSLDSKLRFNDLSRLIEYNGTSLPVDEASIFYVSAQKRGHLVGEKQCHDALLHQSYQNRFDPIVDYLKNIEADDSIKPVPLNSLATKYLGTTDPLYDAMLKVAVLGAVHRRLNPGCQFDVVVVLKGDQGIRKSTFWKVLASPQWYCSTVPDSDKDLVMNIHQTWVFELAELENVTTKREVGQMKNLVTTCTDHIRVPYGRAMEEKERQSIFVSSVNGDSFLRDETGHRRYLVIECPQRFDAGELIDVAAVVRDRNRIWKAALIACRNGELPMLSAERQLESNQRNSGFEIESPFEGPIARWLSAPSTPARFTSDQALTLSGCRNEGQIKRADQMELTNLLNKLGYFKNKGLITVGGVRGRFWQKVNDHDSKTPSCSQDVQVVVQPQNLDTDTFLPLTEQHEQPYLIKDIEEENKGDMGASGGSTGNSEKGCEVVHPPSDDTPEWMKPDW